jgi:hypothetical protein
VKLLQVKQDVEREREQIKKVNRVRDRALDRNGSGVGQKWMLVKLKT